MTKLNLSYIIQHLHVTVHKYMKLTAGGQNSFVKSSMELRANMWSWFVIKTAVALKNDSNLLAFWLLLLACICFLDKIPFSKVFQGLFKDSISSISTKLNEENELLAALNYLFLQLSLHKPV